MAQIDGSALIAKSIAKEGITTLFGLTGGPIVEIMGYAPHYGVRPIGVRHEQAATFSAAAYGYVRNEAGVTRDYLRTGAYELEVATVRVAARIHLAPLYDPKMERVKA